MADRRINSEGLEIIKRWETLALKAYICPAGVLSIGYGHTGDVKPSDRITEHQAEAILEVDLDRFERTVEETVPGLSDNRFSACVSCAFNIGVTAFRGSTLARKAKAGDFTGAALEFARWNKGGGKVLPGLVKRREDERALFLKG